MSDQRTQSITITEKLIVEPHRFIYEGPKIGKSGLGAFAKVVARPQENLDQGPKTESLLIGSVTFSVSEENEAYALHIPELMLANTRKNSLGGIVSSDSMDDEVNTFRRQHQAILQRMVGKSLSTGDLEEIKEHMAPYNLSRLKSVQTTALIQSDKPFAGGRWVEASQTYNTSIKSKKFYVSDSIDLDRVIKMLRDESALAEAIGKSGETHAYSVMPVENVTGDGVRYQIVVRPISR